MSKFKQGHKKLGGKSKGTVNKKTMLWENLGNFFIEDGAERAMQIMQSSNNKDFMDYYTKLIELFKPKQQRTESTVNINQMPSPQVIAPK